MENIEIRIIQDLNSEWRQMIEPWCSFFHNEPICSMVTAFRDPVNKDKLIEMLQDRVESDPNRICVLAWDMEKEKAAGMLLTTILYKVPPPPTVKPDRSMTSFGWDEEALVHLTDLEAFLNKMLEESNIVNKFHVDKVLLIDITSVCNEYTRRGLAHRMTEAVIEEGKKRGYSLIASESTSRFTQKNKIERLGFESVMEFDFSKCYANYSSMPENVRKVHNKAAVLVKHI